MGIGCVGMNANHVGQHLHIAVEIERCINTRRTSLALRPLAVKCEGAVFLRVHEEVVQDVVVLVWVGIEDSALRTIPPLVFGEVKLPVDIAHESLGRELHMSRVLQTDVPVAAVVGVAAIRIASCEECLRRSPSVGMHRVVVQVSPP